MTKQEFKEYVHKECLKRGFIKVRNSFFLLGTDLLCGVSLQKSNYGNVFYVNFDFYLGDYQNIKKYPSQYESDIGGRITVMSKTQTYQGKHFMTSLIEYEEYTEDELQSYFDKAFDELIIPPVLNGCCLTAHQTSHAV